MADTLLRQLGPLSKGFTSPATNVAAARQLRELADGLSDRMNPGELENGMLQSIRQLSNASKAELFSKLVRLAARLAGLDAVLHGSTAAAGGGSCVSRPVRLQLDAAWSSIVILHGGAEALDFPPALVQAVHPLLSLLLRGGEAVLASELQAGQRRQNPRQQQAQLLQGGRDDASHALYRQLELQCLVMHMLLHPGTGIEQQLTPPAEQLAAVMPWLVTTAAGIRRCIAEDIDTLEVLQQYVQACAGLLAGDWLLGQTPAATLQQQEAVISLLMDVALPSAAAALDSDSDRRTQEAILLLANIYQPLTGDSLRQALRQRLRQGGATATAVQLAARTAAALAAVPPGAARADDVQVAAHSSMCCLASELPWAAFEEPSSSSCAAAPTDTSGGEAATGAGPAGGDSRREPAAAGGGCGSECGSEAAAAGEAASECASACRSLLRCFPSLAACLRLPDFGGACKFLNSALQFVAWDAQHGRHRSEDEYVGAVFDSPRHVVWWARATRAALHLLPLLARRHTQEQQGTAGAAGLAAEEAVAAPAAAAAAPQEAAAAAWEQQPSAAAAPQEAAERNLSQLQATAAGQLVSTIVVELFANGAGFLVEWGSLICRSTSGDSDGSCSSHSSSGSSGGQTAAAAAVVLKPLRRVHEAACRCLHWLLSEAGAALLSRYLLQRVLSGLCALLFVFDDLSRFYQDQSSGKCGALWLQGACAFHWAAMEAAADWLQSTCISGSDSNRAAQQSDAALLCSLSRPARRFPDSIQLCNAITRVAAHCPQLATPRLCAMIKEWCAMAAEEDQEPCTECNGQDGFAFLIALADRAMHEPCLAAPLMAHGVLLPLLHKIARLARGGVVPSIMQGRRYLFTARNLMISLEEAAQEAADQLGGSSSAAGGSSSAAAGGSSSAAAEGQRQLAAELQAALGAYREAEQEAHASLEAAGHRSPRLSPLEQALKFELPPEDATALAAWLQRESHELALEADVYTQLLQPAAHLAAALPAARQQQPGQQLADAVQLARAAATRGCANLRCAELEGAGKSLPCGACRTSRYCCRACSVADWRRGGHKRVCAVLAAERQQRVAGEGDQ